jgi:hypothetical protein
MREIPAPKLRALNGSQVQRRDHSHGAQEVEVCVPGDLDNHQGRPPVECPGLELLARRQQAIEERGDAEIAEEPEALECDDALRRDQRRQRCVRRGVAVGVCAPNLYETVPEIAEVIVAQVRRFGQQNGPGKQAEGENDSEGRVPA